MLGRAFLIASGAFVVLLAFAFWQDANREYTPVQQRYAQQYGADFQVGQIQQLFPKVKVNGDFKVERCITCHVPDIQKLGPQEAARRIGATHPAVIDDAVFAKYGQDTLICKGGAAAPAAAPSASPVPTTTPAPANPAPSASATTAATPAAPGASATPSQSPGTQPGAAPGSQNNPGPAGAHCGTPGGVPFYVLDVTGKPVMDPATGKPVVAQLTGFLPRTYLGLGIDETGCIICHNGNRQATSMAGAHQNLVSNPFHVYDAAPTLYENDCAQCHGATGEGLRGPPLNDQDRLGFFNDDYYQRCIYSGNRGSEHLGSIMPAWGLNHLLPRPIDRNINLLVDWIRLWQQYTSLP